MFLKRILMFILIMTLLLPSFVYGEGVANRDWIIDKGYFGVGGLNLDKKINRAGFATVTIRLMALEDEALNYKGKPGFTDIENFQDGWAKGYISLAKERGLMSGRSKDIFNPEGYVTYIEMLTVLMRVLGYEDGVDFIKYPDDYLKKALEIGLGDMYTPKDEEVLREVVLDTMIKALNTPMKDRDYTLFQRLDAMPKKETPIVQVKMENLKFNSVVAGTFSGELKGDSDFKGYKVVLLGKNGAIYGDKVLSTDGKFSLSGFDIGVVAKTLGYRYEVYNKDGKLVLQGDLK